MHTWQQWRLPLGGWARACLLGKQGRAVEHRELPGIRLELRTMQQHIQYVPSRNRLDNQPEARDATYRPSRGMRSSERDVEQHVGQVVVSDVCHNNNNHRQRQ